MPLEDKSENAKVSDIPWHKGAGTEADAVQAMMTNGSLSRSAAHFSRPSGPNLLSRTEEFANWQGLQAESGIWPYARSLDGSPQPVLTIRNENGEAASGINFASQDYLSLTTHPAIIDACWKATRDSGPHSAGSAVLLGNSKYSLALEEALGDMLAMSRVVLFPTGWGAGFGTISALVRSDDYVILDEFAHACLKQGAQAATPNVFKHKHLEVDAVREQLREIRGRDSKNGILVVTEGLFSMDSDSPDLRNLQNTCREYEAILLVDVAHDLGAMGPNGTGAIGLQGMLGNVDLVVGAFSKTFASNGGFLATRSKAVRQYVKMFGGTHVFSNALSPTQAAVVAEALRISRSDEGTSRRHSLMAVVAELRRGFAAHAAKCLGIPSAIVPLLVGNQKILRIASAMTFRRGVFANSVEFPAVPVGASRFRLQAMAGHTIEHAREAVDVLVGAIEEARRLLNPGE